METRRKFRKELKLEAVKMVKDLGGVEAGGSGLKSQREHAAALDT
jgi:hypothetical protein